MTNLINKTIRIALKPELFDGQTPGDVEAECLGCLAVHPVYKSKTTGLFTVTHVPTGLALVNGDDRLACIGFMLDVLSHCQNIEVVTAEDIKNRNAEFYMLAKLVHSFNGEEYKLEMWDVDEIRTTI